MSGIISQPRFTCALGAQQTVLAIPKAIPIIHAGPGCSMKIFDYAATGAGRQGEGYAGGNHVSCTNASETDVVFGGEEKLRSVIEGAIKILKGDLFVVLSGCTAGIIGDDVEKVAKVFARDGRPLVGVETSGFKGNNYFGHEAVVVGIIDQFVGEARPPKKKGTVNVFSVVPYQDPYWRGDLEQIKSLLEKIGLRVNILFGAGSKGTEEWKNIPKAEFNILLSPWVGLSIVTHLEEKYGAPFFHYPVLPVGAKETSAFLRAVGEYAQLSKETVERIIAEEERRYYDYFVSIGDFIALYQNNLPYELYTSADSLYAIGITKYLENEVGYIPKGIYITDDPNPANLEQVKEIAAKNIPEYQNSLLFEADGEIIAQDIKEKLGTSTRALLIGSDWEREIARETGNLFQYLSNPINQKLIIRQTFVGYQGGLNLLEEIYGALFAGEEVSAATYVEAISGGL
ncbi:MAG: hydrogenase [Peptococcaceae bacterium]|jgi:nitrogenase molybdenum-iron protein beta chain|nr:hydrogenase [Peptococcaceae bacterium]